MKGKWVVNTVITSVLCILVLTNSTWAKSQFLPLFQGQTVSIPFQGRLTDMGGAPLTGPYAMTFRMYQSQSGGSPLWEESKGSVQVNSGIFNVMLSVSEQVITSNTSLYIGVSIGSDQEMSPRIHVGSVPWAVQTSGGGTGSTTGNQVVSVELGSFGTQSTSYVDIPGSELSVTVSEPSTLLVGFSGSIFTLMQTNSSAGVVLTVNLNGIDRTDLVTQDLSAWSGACCAPNPAIAPAGFMVPISVEAGTHVLTLRILSSSYNPNYRAAGIGYNGKKSTFSVIVLDR